jgi:hypothetical protein
MPADSQPAAHVRATEDAALAAGTTAEFPWAADLLDRLRAAAAITEHVTTP